MTGRDELLAEALRAAKLRRPGIVPVHDMGRLLDPVAPLRPHHLRFNGLNDGFTFLAN